jgi:hypothetical protein
LSRPFTFPHGFVQAQPLLIDKCSLAWKLEHVAKKNPELRVPCTSCTFLIALVWLVLFGRLLSTRVHEPCCLQQPVALSFRGAADCWLEGGAARPQWRRTTAECTQPRLSRDAPSILKNGSFFIICWLQNYNWRCNFKVTSRRPRLPKVGQKARRQRGEIALIQLLLLGCSVAWPKFPQNGFFRSPVGPL